MTKETAVSSIITIPTDTCYGFACSFNDAVWYKQIYNLKWRTQSKPLSLVVKSFQDIPKYVQITQAQLEFLSIYPYPFTLLAKPIISLPWFLPTEAYSYLGIRVWEKCIDLDIHKNISYPLFLTSANWSGEKECYSRQEVLSEFGSDIAILWEESGWNPPSNVFSFIDDTLELEYKRRNYG